jgi:hypothetical protein
MLLEDRPDGIDAQMPARPQRIRDRDVVVTFGDTAQRALRHGVAMSVVDPRRAQLRGARGGDFDPLAPDVVDLDAIEEPKGVQYLSPDPVMAAANFQPLDRGPERMLKVTP